MFFFFFMENEVSFCSPWASMLGQIRPDLEEVDEESSRVALRAEVAPKAKSQIAKFDFFHAI